MFGEQSSDANAVDQSLCTAAADRLHDDRRQQRHGPRRRAGGRRLHAARQRRCGRREQPGPHRQCRLHRRRQQRDRHRHRHVVRAWSGAAGGDPRCHRQTRQAGAGHAHAARIPVRRRSISRSRHPDPHPQGDGAADGGALRDLFENIAPDRRRSADARHRDVQAGPGVRGHARTDPHRPHGARAALRPLERARRHRRARCRHWRALRRRLGRRETRARHTGQRPRRLEIRAGCAARHAHQDGRARPRPGSAGHRHRRRAGLPRADRNPRARTRRCRSFAVQRARRQRAARL